MDWPLDNHVLFNLFGDFLLLWYHYYNRYLDLLIELDEFWDLDNLFLSDQFGLFDLKCLLSHDRHFDVLGHSVLLWHHKSFRNVYDLEIIFLGLGKR